MLIWIFNAADSTRRAAKRQEKRGASSTIGAAFVLAFPWRNLYPTLLLRPSECPERRAFRIRWGMEMRVRVSRATRDRTASGPRGGTPRESGCPDRAWSSWTPTTVLLPEPKALWKRCAVLAERGGAGRDDDRNVSPRDEISGPPRSESEPRRQGEQRS